MTKDNEFINYDGEPSQKIKPCKQLTREEFDEICMKARYVTIPTKEKDREGVRLIFEALK